jgi:hypothetical protein
VALLAAVAHGLGKGLEGFHRDLHLLAGAVGHYDYSCAQVRHPGALGVALGVRHVAPDHRLRTS